MRRELKNCNGINGSLVVFTERRGIRGLVGYPSFLSVMDFHAPSPGYILPLHHIPYGPTKFITLKTWRYP